MLVWIGGPREEDCGAGEEDRDELRLPESSVFWVTGCVGVEEGGFST